jgi:uncharacterized protein
MQVSAMAGRVVHFEIPAEDQDRAKEFYTAAFGWNINAMPEIGYTSLGTTPTDGQGMPTEPGAINGGMFRREGELTGPIITVDVDDIDATLEKIRSLGGSIVRAKGAVPQMGYFAYFRDSEGNVMGLWQTDPAAG